MAAEKYKDASNLSTDIKKSIGFHIAVVAVFALQQCVFFSEDVSYQSAIRVDIVDLPDKIQASSPKATASTPPPAPAAKPPPPKQVEKAPVPAPAPKADTQKAAIDRLKALQKIEDSVATQKKQDDAIAKLQQFKGNQISSGSALSGTDKIQYDLYIDQLDGHIKNNWDLPRWLAEENLSAKVRVRISSTGHLIQKRLTQSSGNPAYDDVAMNTIDKASPFPVPPSKFQKILENEGFTIEFKKEAN